MRKPKTPDTDTLTLPGVAARRGRPPTGKAKTGAERLREFRARRAAEGLETISVEVSAEVAAALRAYCKRRSADAEEMTMGQAAERILRDRLLRKR